MKFLKVTLMIIYLTHMAVAIAKAKEESVRDTSGQPLQRGVEYYIKPAITDHGGRFTLARRNNTCPYFAAQEATSAGLGLPVKFDPFFENQDKVKVGRDFKVSFAAATICFQSTTWQLDGELIGTGVEEEGYGNYFHITKGEVEKTYYIGWCPTDACPTCHWLRCGRVGAVVEDGTRFLAWASSFPLPVVFERASY